MLYTRLALLGICIGACAAHMGSHAVEESAGSAFQYSVNSTEYTVTWHKHRSMPFAVSDATASTVGDKIYLIGGCDSPMGNEMDPQAGMHVCKDISDHVMIFDPMQDQWTTGMKIPQARFRHAATVVGTDIYIIGGRDLSDTILKTILQYSTVTNTWSTVVSNFTDATSDNAAFTHGTDVYVCGGYVQDYSSASRDCFVLDTTASNPTMQAFGYPMWQGRGDFSIISFENSVYTIGGFNSKFEALSTVSRLNLPAVQGWQLLDSTMVHGRGDFGAVAFKSRILVIGGENGTDSLTAGASLRHVEAFDPRSQSWLPVKTHAPIPYAAFRFCAATSGDSVYIFGGQAPHNQACDCYKTLDNVLAYTETIHIETDDISSAERSMITILCALFVAFVLQ